MTYKNIILLGATGSIGTSTLNLIRKKREKFNLIGVSTYEKTEQLKLISEEFNVKNVCFFKNDNDVIYHANDVSVGLASYVFTESLDRAWRFSEELEFGMVSINEGIMSTVVAPFGGIKESGLGREGSALGLDEYTEVKYVNFGGLQNF